MEGSMDNNSFKDFINQDYPGLADWINTLNAYEFTSIATLIGLAISPLLTVNQQNALGNFFEQIGQTMLTIGAQNQNVNQYKNAKNKSKANDNISKEINNMKDELEKLKKKMNDNNI